MRHERIITVSEILTLLQEVPCEYRHDTALFGRFGLDDTVNEVSIVCDCVMVDLPLRTRFDDSLCDHRSLLILPYDPQTTLGQSESAIAQELFLQVGALETVTNSVVVIIIDTLNAVDLLEHLSVPINGLKIGHSAGLSMVLLA